jgi:hypothetical protein
MAVRSENLCVNRDRVVSFRAAPLEQVETSPVVGPLRRAILEIEIRGRSPTMCRVRSLVHLES